MTNRLLRHISWLLLLFYLLSGHAAAHGLTWCLDADTSAHLELSFGHCGDSGDSGSSQAFSCTAEYRDGEHPADGREQADCRHLPLTAPHRNVVGQVPLADDGAELSPPAATVVAAAVPDNPGVLPCSRLRAAQLPLSQTLTAQRYIVLTC